MYLSAQITNEVICKMKDFFFLTKVKLKEDKDEETCLTAALTKHSFLIVTKDQEAFIISNKQNIFERKKVKDIIKQLVEKQILVDEKEIFDELNNGFDFELIGEAFNG